MATLIGYTRMALRCRGVFQRSLVLGAVPRRPDSTMASVGQTLDVKQRIEDTRKKALLGGGQRRIDVQHKKVKILVIF